MNVSYNNLFLIKILYLIRRARLVCTICTNRSHFIVHRNKESSFVWYHISPQPTISQQLPPCFRRLPLWPWALWLAGVGFFRALCLFLRLCILFFSLNPTNEVFLPRSSTIIHKEKTFSSPFHSYIYLIYFSTRLFDHF